ncbi:hypothetical protein GCM10023205_71130 [Yinghuangia aomiensis]|uniref:Uncharacterized protein n=1 Tax=Yinghuangia aomiensis TaxID=676205 RepID=A0ABP9I686_9ACTN
MLAAVLTLSWVVTPAPAFAGDPEGLRVYGDNCLIVPEDIWGVTFHYYCAIPDTMDQWNQWTASDAQYVPDGEPKTNLDITPPKCRAASVPSCSKGSMMKWMQDVGTVADLHENPCDGLPAKWRSLCVSPVGQNPCLSAKSDMARNKCQQHYPGFKQLTPGQLSPDESCQNLTGGDRQKCLLALGPSQTKSEGADIELQDGLQEGLGWLLLAACTACFVGVLLTGAGMAGAWYTGNPALVHFTRLGWVILAAIGVGSASGVASIFLL